MTTEQLQHALKGFLTRITLTPNEIPTYVEVVRWIEDLEGKLKAEEENT